MANQPAPRCLRSGKPAGGLALRPDWTIDQHWERYSAEEHAVGTAPAPVAAAGRTSLRRIPGRTAGAADRRRASRVPAPERGADVPDWLSWSRCRDWCPMRSSSSTWPIAAFRPAGSSPREPARLPRRAGRLPGVFGHVPMLMNPVMADFVQAYGVGGLRARGLGVLPELARVYWYTVEFGLVRQPEGAANLWLGHPVVERRDPL